MIDVFLVPEKTIVTAKGDSAAVDVSGAAKPVFLATLTITKVVEQESMEVNFYTSADGTTWEAKPVATLAQKFYVGEHPVLIDLGAAAGVKFLRAHWDVNRWGRGSTVPNFECSLRLREVSREALQEAAVEAQIRR